MRLVVVDHETVVKFDEFDDLDNMVLTPRLVRSVGWLYRDQDGRIVLISQWQPNDHRAAGVLVIPSGAVVSVKDLEAGATPPEEPHADAAS